MEVERGRTEGTEKIHDILQLSPESLAATCFAVELEGLPELSAALSSKTLVLSPYAIAAGRVSRIAAHF
eukprot:2696635-Pyramimonas_sp.AAC.1